jgi:hypothetical protein
VLYYAHRIMREDNQTCERLQQVAHQIDKSPFLSTVEDASAGSNSPTGSSSPMGKRYRSM